VAGGRPVTRRKLSARDGARDTSMTIEHAPENTADEVPAGTIYTGRRKA
jgi:hypothetical protein